MMARASVFLLVLLAAGTGGCGHGGEGGFDGGTPGRGGTCTVQDDCFGCGVCRLPYDEVCLEGQCWLSAPPDGDGDPKTGSYLILTTFPDGLDRTRITSAAIRIYDARRSDGGRLTCEALLADPVASDSWPELNRVRVLEPRLQVSATSDQAAMGVTAAIGADRVVLVRLHEAPNGEGALLAIGCVEGVRIVQGDPCTSDAECGRLRCETGAGGERRCGPQPLEVSLSMP